MGILYPAFALFALTMFVQFRLGMMRFSAVRDGKVDPHYYRLYEGTEPEFLRVWSRHLQNLYEAPILFYAIVVIGFVSGQSGTLPTALAWLYVGSRCLHSYVHLAGNRVIRRFRAFLLSLVILAALWLTVLTGMLLR